MSGPVPSSTSNIALLIVSFAIGQGAIFIAQTHLVAIGQLTLLANFGTHFTITTLAALIVDAGALTQLARRTAQAPDDPSTLWRHYWEMSAVRVTLAMILLIAVALPVATLSGGFSASFALTASPGLLLWAFNANGMLDGRNRSGLSGAAAVPIYLLPAIALTCVSAQSSAWDGSIIGVAISLGYALTTLTQWVALKQSGLVPIWVRPTSAGIVHAAQEGLSLLLSALPGQVLFRVQILLCGVLLGPAATALFLYARQISAALSQLLGFVRRAEFPALVQAVGGSRYPLGTLLRLQRGGTLLALLASGALLLVGALVARLGPIAFVEAGHAVALFSAGVLTGAIYLAMAQGSYAIGRPQSAAFAANLGLCAGLLASVFLPQAFGLAGFAIAEVVMHVVGGAWLYRALRQRPYRRLSPANVGAGP